ncbi:hypothetical protein [Marinobacterium lutimaris]|uniref:Uncharacterized protein n=1 Tax=Marinobacterium lutimaris TaxID=568106 RepID=A0A1H5U2B5_9GAMM|nr:hypothetical protein [Marinobacterium lutimaris]SEF69186.1 hypothetical protein SAMN05444390_101242 [Marinobacterium lutimaris]
MRSLTLIGCCFALFLAGCVPGNGQPGAAAGGDGAAAEPQAALNAKPDATLDATPDARAQAPAETPRAAADGSEGASAGGSAGSLGNQLDQLNGRLTLVQEQLMQLRAQVQQQGELNQMVLTRLQQMPQQSANSQDALAAMDAEGASSVDGSQVDAAIAQLLQTVNELGLSSNSDLYGVATTYTSRGVWVLIRYRRDTGETWLADQGRWAALDEEGYPAASSYEVKLQRADQDLKGYVAVRIDRNTGESWWLNDRRWQRYE